MNVRKTNPPVLEIRELSVSFRTFSPEGEESVINAVNKVSLSLEEGKMLALVGESGSGKSVTALSILQLLPYPTAFHPSGMILFNSIDLMKMRGTALEAIRGNKISMIFQEPMTSLNPLHTIEKQLAEVITLHKKLDKIDVDKRIAELLEMVDLHQLKDRLNAYPHELSGGQRQRVMIAMALANNPKVLIADEPTTALDVTVQAEILALLKDLQRKLGMSILMITHDLTIVENMADNVAVMKNGFIVEHGLVKQVFSKPRHPYTKHLLSSAPSGNPVKIKPKSETIIKAENFNVTFPIKTGFFNLTKRFIKAVDDAKIQIKSGHTLGVVGESGSGKSTLALGLLRLIKSDGLIEFLGDDLRAKNKEELRHLRQKMQIVFQDPYASLNPRLTIRETIEEGLKAHEIEEDPAKRLAIVKAALKEVGLDPEFASRYPHEFSGGQRQRICIARALVLKPSFIVLDEPTSALDLSTQAEIIDLLKNLQKQHNLTYLFISHDLRVIKAISHNIIVMKDGKIVEKGKASSVFSRPKTQYTKSLIKAAFNLEAA